MMGRILTVCAASSWVIVGAAAARGATQAYWRFEDRNGAAASAGSDLRSTPAAGGTISAGNTVDVTSDSSGNGNVLRTFHSPNVPDSADGLLRLETSPEFTADVPGPIVPRTGAPNLLAFDMDAQPGIDQQPAGTAPNEAGADDVYTENGENVRGSIASYVFNQFTIEASFKIDTLGRFQKVVGKDDPADVAPGGLGPLTFGPLNNNVLEIVAFDGSGAFRNVLGDQLHPGVDGPGLLKANRWYHAAVTNDGSTMSLYLDDTTDGVGNYVLLGTNNSITGGALLASDANWSVGRGWFNGPADFFDGQIDEVRISDVALSPSEFLFAIPEPSGVAMGLAGLVALGRVGRRNGRRAARC